MNGHFAEITMLFVMVFVTAIVALLALDTNFGWSLIFAILSGGAGIYAFGVIFADIHRTEKLFGNWPYDGNGGLESR